MLIQACTIIRIQPFPSAILLSLKSRCFQSKKLKIKLMKSQKNEANFANFPMVLQLFLFPEPMHTGFFFVFTICCLPFLTFPHYTIILSFTIIDFLRFFHPVTIISPYTIFNFCRFVHPIPLFCPIAIIPVFRVPDFRAAKCLFLVTKHFPTILSIIST